MENANAKSRSLFARMLLFHYYHRGLRCYRNARRMIGTDYGPNFISLNFAKKAFDAFDSREFDFNNYCISDFVPLIDDDDEIDFVASVKNNQDCEVHHVTRPNNDPQQLAAPLLQPKITPNDDVIELDSNEDDDNDTEIDTDYDVKISKSKTPPQHQPPTQQAKNITPNRQSSIVKRLLVMTGRNGYNEIPSDSATFAPQPRKKLCVDRRLSSPISSSARKDGETSRVEEPSSIAATTTTVSNTLKMAGHLKNCASMEVKSENEEEIVIDTTNAAAAVMPSSAPPQTRSPRTIMSFSPQSLQSPSLSPILSSSSSSSITSALLSKTTKASSSLQSRPFSTTLAQNPIKKTNPIKFYPYESNYGNAARKEPSLIALKKVELAKIKPSRYHKELISTNHNNKQAPITEIDVDDEKLEADGDELNYDPLSNLFADDYGKPKNRFLRVSVPLDRRRCNLD